MNLKPYKTLLSLGIPIVIGQIGVIVLGFVDTLMIGHHSTNELAAASFVNNMFNLAIIFCTGFSYGLTPIVGSLFGQQKCNAVGQILKNSLAVQNKVKENHHVPMTVDEVCIYLGISKSSFYYKVKHGGIPVIKQGKHLFVYRDELDKWLETGRKVQVPLTFEEEQTQMLAATRRKANPKNV